MSVDQRIFVVIEEPEAVEDPPRIKVVSWPRGEPGKTARFRVPDLPDFDEPGEDALRLAREHGGALLEALREDRTLRRALRDALSARAGEVRPLCFKVEGEAPDAMGLRWEARWDSSEQFLALKDRWPIGRVVESDIRSVRTFEPPLRILAIMSGAGLDARQEWEALHRAVEEARSTAWGPDGKKMWVRVTLVVGDQGLADEVMPLAQEAPNWLDVVLMEDEATIDSLLRDKPPHIVHFFCHGSVRQGEGSLDFATIADQAERGDRRRDSISVSVSRLATFVRTRKPWLVVLNCCDTAVETVAPSSSDDTQSLAREVVAAGAAAAIGWRHTIRPADANALTDTVYRRLLTEIGERLVTARPGTLVDFELTSTAFVARDRLRVEHRDDHDVMRWTLPVLFVLPDPLSVLVYKDVPDDAGDLAVSEVDEGQGAVIAEFAKGETLDSATQLDPRVAAAVERYLAQRGRA